MEEERDPFEGTSTPVGLTPPSVGSRSHFFGSSLTFSSTTPAVDSTPPSVDLTPPSSGSTVSEGEDKDPFEDTVLTIEDVYSGNAISDEFIPPSDTPRKEWETSDDHCENLKEAVDMYIINEDLSTNKEKRNVLYELITEAIMETNNGVCTKGFCTLKEIYDYIAKLRLVDLSDTWRKDVYHILYEKRTDFIHIPCGNLSFQEGSWTLHPLVAKHHKPVKRSPVKSRNGSSPENHNGVHSEISMVQTLTELEESEQLPWYGWKKQSAITLAKLNDLRKCISERKAKSETLIDKEAHSETLSTPLKRKSPGSNEFKTKRRKKMSPQSASKSSPAPANNSSLTGGARIDVQDWIGDWRGWDKWPTKHRDTLKLLIKQLEKNFGLEDELEQCVPENQPSRFPRLYFNNSNLSQEYKRNSTIEQKSTEEYADLVNHQLKELFKGYAYSMQEPPYSYIILIVMALSSTEKGKLMPEEIMNFIKEKFPFYQAQKEWKYAICTVLQWNKVFNKRCSSNCTAKNEKNHEGCWKIDVITASELLGKALDSKSRVNQGTEENTNLPNVTPEKENGTVRESSPRVVSHQKKGVLFIHQTEEQQQFKENLNLNNLNIQNDHHKVGTEKLNGTSVIVYSTKSCDTSRAEVSSKESDHSHGDVETATESLLLLATAMETSQDLTREVEALNNNVENSSSQECSPVYCQFCQDGFNCGFMLQVHVNTHLREPCNPCFLCHSFHTSAYTLWTHSREKHANKDNLHTSSALCQKSLAL